MLKKLIGGFHFTFSLLGTEVFSMTLFTEEDQVIGDWSEDDDGEDDDDDDGDDDPGTPVDPTDAMLDTLNEIVRWEGGQG